MMNDTLSLETVIEYIESLSPEDEALLFDKLHRRRLEKPSQSRQTAATTEALSTGNAACDMNAAEPTEFYGDRGKGTYHVLIKKESDGTVRATLLGWPECQGSGNTRSEAMLQLKEVVDAQLGAAEIVPVTIHSTQSANPWVRLAGKYKDDPLFDDFLADMEAYRRELDAEMEAYDDEIKAEVGAK